MNDRQKAILARVREMRRQSNEHDGGYPTTDEGRLQALFDHVALAEVTLADYPPGDDCEMSRTELIAELKRWEHGCK